MRHAAVTLLAALATVFAAKDTARPASLKFALAQSGIAAIKDLVDPVLVQAVLSAKVPDFKVRSCPQQRQVSLPLVHLLLLLILLFWSLLLV
jgi:hypothetical protein